jgi:hypothetical protein
MMKKFSQKTNPGAREPPGKLGDGVLGCRVGFYKGRRPLLGFQMRCKGCIDRKTRAFSQSLQPDSAIKKVFPNGKAFLRSD